MTDSAVAVDRTGSNELITEAGAKFTYYSLAKLAVEGWDNPSDSARRVVFRSAEENARAAERWSPQTIGGYYLGTIVYLIPTNNCQLGCTYCYANAGETDGLTASPDERLHEEQALVAVEKVCRNAKVFGDAGRVRKASVRIIGGGEPTLDWRWLTEVVAGTRRLAEKYEVTLELRIVTNGILSVGRAEWIGGNFDIVHLSMDGPPDIQDAQRPFPTGTGSSYVVERSLRVLCASRGRTTIRSTWTALSVGRGREIAQFFFGQFPRLKVLHIEPASASPVGRETFTPPTAEEFVETFKECYVAAESLGHAGRVITSRLQTTVNSSFCKSTQGRAVYITPSGEVSNCNEVSSSHDPRWSEFHLGEVSPSGELRVIGEAGGPAVTSGERNSNRPECEGCIAQWSCRGGCRASYLSDPDRWARNWCAQVQPLSEWLVGRCIDSAVSKGQIISVPEKAVEIPDIPDWKSLLA